HRGAQSRHRRDHHHRGRRFRRRCRSRHPAAGEAQADWAATAPRERAEILRRAFELLTERADDIAAVMTAEMGKPFAESKGEVAYGAEFFRWFSEEAVRFDGEYAQSADGKTRVMV